LGLKRRNGAKSSTGLLLKPGGQKLTAYAMKDAAFRFYVSQKERKIAFNRSGQVHQYLLRNTNQLLGTQGVDGVKTGSTARAGECIIISSQHDPEITQ
jgi:D-alanyl-D-alanine carboxypeptidase (penicillin-binding protein 5/6)